MSQPSQDSMFAPVIDTSHWADQSRGKDNPESKAAYARLDEDTDTRHVLTLVESAGDFGITLHESCEAMGREPNEISGRFTRLRHTTKQIKTAGRREWKGHTGAIYVRDWSVK
jgi:hypothetical protein